MSVTDNARMITDLAFLVQFYKSFGNQITMFFKRIVSGQIFEKSYPFMALKLW